MRRRRAGAAQEAPGMCQGQFGTANSVADLRGLLGRRQAGDSLDKARLMVR
ncbi:hypothetical protein GCM10010216_67570 [Streptomyces flaveolus]|nr:hypothetical protein GCM10010216_67570 [Streptomyces flaveolus]